MAKTGIKFTERYSVKTGNIYRGDTEALKIPHRGHFLYDPTAPVTHDPIRVAAIDRDGHMTTPIEVWSEPDTNTLWVLDGRGRTLDVREVNRLRAADGRELIEPYIVPFDGDEKAAVARVREKNYHRREMTFVGMAVDLQVMRKKGISWEECAKALHVETKDPEQWARNLLPLAYCCDEVQQAIESGDIPRTAAKKFGGGKPGGEDKLGKQEQLDLLAKMLKAKESAAKKKPAVVTPKQRERAVAALSNGATAKLRGEDLVVAEAVRAAMARIDGDKDALKAWPKVASIVDEALKPLPKGPTPKMKQK